MSVTLELEHDVDIARGDLLARPADQPALARRLHSTVIWMNEEPLDSRKGYLLQHSTRVIPARLHGVAALNEIARVEVDLAEPLPYDTYKNNRATGGFILIDPITNLTMAAGLIEGEVTQDEAPLQSFSDEQFTPAERRRLRALLAHMQRFGLTFDEGFAEGEGI
jgi:sulfate adenylyltransferase subunit 1 (EFTu-like GTPase family)